MKGFIREFKEFISRGNMVDMAIGIIIGGAFTTVVNSLVTNIIQPLLGAIGGSSELQGMVVTINGQIINFGAFISAIISFLITGLILFSVIKALNNASKRAAKIAQVIPGVSLPEKTEGDPEPRLCPYCKQEVDPDATRCPHCTSMLEGSRDA